MIAASLGNRDLLKLPKTAFLCSRTISAPAVLRCYDWAIQQREAGHCVISGFHSPIEKDVLHYLLKGQQAIIIALARSMKQKLEPELKTALGQNRLLIISPFPAGVTHVTQSTADTRNKLMCSLADSITIGYASPGGQLDHLIQGLKKPIEFIYGRE